MKQIVNNIEF